MQILRSSVKMQSGIFEYTNKKGETRKGNVITLRNGVELFHNAKAEETVIEYESYAVGEIIPWDPTNKFDKPFNKLKGQINAQFVALGKEHEAIVESALV